MHSPLRASLAGLLALIALFILPAALPLSAAADEQVVKDQVKCCTTWDPNYFYVAFKVDCPDVRGTHSAPNADVVGDDVVEFYVETDDAKSVKITPQCFSMSVSAAGGSLCRAGNESGTLAPIPVFTFKYGTGIQGTLNNADDIDMGYSVEMAVPWSVLKRAAPVMGDQIGFNVIVRRSGDKSAPFVSLSPRVKTEEDATNPSKWVRMVFAAHTFGVATISVEKIVSAKYIARSPLVEGVIGDKEWHRNTSFTMDLPMPEGFVYEAKFPPQRMLLATYSCDYRSDESGPKLVDFPVRNAGPWFGADSIQWHKDELSDMVASGVDVVLPVYDGSQSSDAASSRTGLGFLVGAIRELDAEGKSYPLVGMCLDTTGMAPGTDLKKPDVQQSFYATIRGFFSRIPREYRASAQAAKPRAGQPAAIVFVSSAKPFADMDSSFLTYCNDAFERDFGLALVWVLADGFSGKVQGCDAFAAADPTQPGKCDRSGRIAVATVSPGADTSARAAESPAIRSRMGGQAYQADWDSALKANPHWVLVHDWSGYETGSDIGASREYDRTYIDATKANIKRFLGNRDIDAQYVRWSVPKVIPGKRIAQAEIVIRNIGNSPWRAADGYALSYRWYKSGRYYGESKVRRPLERDVLPGGTVAISIGVATVNAQGAEMPEGDCELRFELIRLSDSKWFSALGDLPLMVPVKIGPVQEWAASYVSCRAPVMAAAGRNYIVRVKARNDGSLLWRRGAAKLGCRLFKVTDHSEEEVPIRELRAVLGKDGKPGEMAEFELDLNLARSDRKSLEVCAPDSGWSYQLRFDIYTGEKWLSEVGTPTCNMAVEVFESDYGPRIVDCDLPPALAAGQTADVKVVLRNMGAEIWDRKKTQLGYHWYHLDGVEMSWDGGSKAPLKLDLPPGMPAVVAANVKAPAYDGQYVLVWDVMIGGKWLSTEPLSRGGDTLPVFVRVTGGKLAFVNLSGACDVSAASPDTDRTAGDFDGKGSSFPAELFPPDTGVTEDSGWAYPAGYKCDWTKQPEGRVSFVYSEKSPGSKVAVACAGQSIDVEDGSYVAMHVLGASVSDSPAVSGQFSLVYKAGSEPAILSMSTWTAGPQANAKPGYMTRHTHTHGGDEVGKAAFLHHYTIRLDASKALTAIGLPANPNMRIVAITLERAALPPPAAQ